MVTAGFRGFFLVCVSTSLFRHVAIIMPSSELIKCLFSYQGILGSHHEAHIAPYADFTVVL
jgi:hypothetical protein